MTSSTALTARKGGIRAAWAVAVIGWVLVAALGRTTAWSMTGHGPAWLGTACWAAAGLIVVASGWSILQLASKRHPVAPVDEPLRMADQADADSLPELAAR